MLKKINASALATRLQSLRPSRQAMLQRFKQGVIAAIAFGGLYVIAPPLWDAVFVSPRQRVEPLNRRINDLDKQINKASPTPSTTDLKEIATLEKGRIDSENTIRTSLFQAVGGLLVFVTLYISWRTLQANEAKQVAERFSKAVEQLGNDNIHVRLGGIYALEQIAKDAEEKYYWQVIETLTSYVRVRSPYPPKAAKTHSSFVQAALETAARNETQDEAIPPLPVDIQAVMTVLARRKHSYGHPLERHPLDLHGADLRRLQLPPNTQLNQANLEETNLQRANLCAVNLQGTNLWKANLKEASLEKSNLKEAHLSRANLQGAFLSEANLQESKLRGANLREASLQDVNLLGASLLGTDLQEASLAGANLQEAYLSGANLQGAYLLGANLQEAYLSGANLQEAILWDTNLLGAKFKRVLPSRNAQSRTQEAIGLTREQLHSSSYYEKDLPNYLQLESPQAEITRSTTQVTESVQSEAEKAATPPEEMQSAPPES